MGDDLENLNDAGYMGDVGDVESTDRIGADISDAYYAEIARIDAGNVSGGELNAFFKGSSAEAIRNATKSLVTKTPPGWDDCDDMDFFEHNEESDRNV